MTFANDCKKTQLNSKQLFFKTSFKKHPVYNQKVQNVILVATKQFLLYVPFSTSIFI